MTSPNHRWYHIKSRYGLTRAAFEEMLRRQGGACALCLRPFQVSASGRTAMRIDHDHACHPANEGCLKCVRGILCVRCNSALLPVLESPEWYERARAYLAAAAKATA